MAYIKITLLILAYTLGIATLVVQIICLIKKIEYKETLLVTISFLLVILATTLDELGVLENPDSFHRNTMFSRVLLVVLATVIPINIHKERILKMVKLRNQLIIICSAVLIFFIIRFYYSKEFKIVDVLTILYINLTVIYSMIAILLSAPSVLIERRNKQEKRIALLVLVSILITIPVELFAFRQILWMNYLFNEPYILSVICIILCVFKLPDDIRRLTMFSIRSKVDVSRLFKYKITPRELEVLKLLIKGKSYKDIGVELFISMSTVKTHVINIYQKLNVKNKVELSNLIK